MAFFDLPTDAELPAESRQMLEEYRRLAGAERVSEIWRVFGHSPKIIEARLKAFQNLNAPLRFSWDAMLTPRLRVATVSSAGKMAHEITGFQLTEELPLRL